MNKKNKVLFTSVGLAILSGIAATSSTFAWFTTTRTASISYTSATVESLQSNLEMKFVSSGNTFTSTLPSTTEVTNNMVFTGVNKVTDISGDGITFFKPTWSANPGIATKIEKITSAENYWIEFTINVKVAGPTAMNVYLGAGTAITAVGGPDSAKAVAASRMAVIVGAATAPTILYAPDADYDDAGETTGHRYLTADSATPVTMSGTATVTEPAADMDTWTTTSIIDEFVTGNRIADVTPGSLVKALASNEDTNVTFRIWLEGEDFDAVSGDDDAIDGVFNIDIKLYALEA